MSLALSLVTGLTLAVGQTVPAPPPAGTAPPATEAAAAATTVKPGDLWLVIYSVLPNRTAEFEGIARQVREAMTRSPQDVRRTQARDLRIHRSALPNADGRVMYFLQIPALLGDADRSGFDVLIEALLPEQATALKQQLTAALDPSNPSGNTYLISVP